MLERAGPHHCRDHRPRGVLGSYTLGEINMTHKETLVKAFSSLNEKQKANLRWHVENETEILCLDRYDIYISKDGGL